MSSRSIWIAVALASLTATAHGETDVPEDELAGDGVAAPAAAAPQAGPPINPFRCRGEAEAITRDLTIGEVHTEIGRRVARPVEDEDPSTIAAHKLCVIAELKRRVGAGDTSDWYERAIAANPDEPGYELWYGAYLGTVRGANGPIVEGAERHYYRGIAKLDRRRASGVALADYDHVTGEWLQRRLLDLYQRDGAPVVGWKSYRYDPGDLMVPGVMLSSVAQTSADTRDFYYGNEMRTFTGEAAFSESALRLGRALSNTERFALVRAPLRVGWNNRLRLRHNWIGAVDLEYRWFRASDAQITEFNKPNEFSDVTVSELGAGFSRVIGVWSLFDVDLAGNVRRTTRTGTIEFLPDQEQVFTTIELTPTVSRFIGPDKLSVRGAYVHMGIPDVEGGTPYERDRGHTIRAAHVEYAMYRPVLLPKLRGGLGLERRYTRGWHFYGGIAEEAIVYGLRQVIQRDHYVGSTLKGLGHYDVTLQGTVYTAGTEFVDEEAPQMGLQQDESQSHSQYRTTVALARRLIDEDITPGLPKSYGGFAPASLVLVVPMSHDLGIKGSDAFENVRVGGELWLKLIATGLGGTTFLVTAGYDYEYFYRQEKAMHMGHLAIRMGW